MIRICSKEESRALDAKAIDMGIPGILLMENAGKGVSEKAFENFNIEAKSVIIFCGKGNNAGDGLVAARHLKANGAHPFIFFTVSPHNLTGDAKKNFMIIKNMSIPYTTLSHFNIKEEDINTILSTHNLPEAGLIIDALLGTGFKGNLKEPYNTLIEYINNLKLPILSIDIPSGMEADGGNSKHAVKANLTATMAFPKYAFFIYPDKEKIGTLEIIDIGLGGMWKGNIHKDEGKIFLIEKKDTYLKKRPVYGHKGSFGKLLIIGGSKGLSGALILATKAALRTGVGLVFTAYPDILDNIVSGSVHSAVKIPLPTKNGVIGEINKDILNGIDAVVLGPGMGNPDISIIKKIMEYTRNIPVLIDADALNLMAKNEIKEWKENMILTPHLIELSRLTKLQPETILKNRFKAPFIKDATVILKGAPTFIYYKDKILIQPVWDSSLSKGGSGDVLSGIIGGLLAQGMSILNASITGTYIHAQAGKYAGKVKTPFGAIPDDYIDFMPDVIAEL